MKLTGKCKKDFEKWLFENDQLRDFINFKCGLTIQNFHLFPQSMQYGVYVDFFDSVGFSIHIHRMYFQTRFYYSIKELYTPIEIEDVQAYESRETARQKAIEKANELYNEKQK